MITTKELLEWHEIVLKTKEQAEELADNYVERNKEIVGYYRHLAKVADAQLSLIERLIEQSIENEKELV